VPIRRGPLQKDVWDFAKRFALALESQAPKLVTAEYRVAKRPAGRVLVDYNQNAWGRTLASVYSVRPRTARSGVDARSRGTRSSAVSRSTTSASTTCPSAWGRVGDLWKPMLAARGRVALEKFL
jgi:bifunctional non-homologous end joining protein LigD